MKLTPKEQLMLPMITSDGSVPKDRLNSSQLEVVDSLIEKRLLKVEDDVVSLTKEGHVLMKVYQSGISYDVLLNNMSNNHLVKLTAKVLEKCHQKDIHIRVVLENMSKEQFASFIDEVAKAVDNRAEEGENVVDAVPAN